jgi:hypothetical protein
MFCMKNGIPYDVVHLMDEWELLAHAVTLAQFENGGKEFDWHSLSWIDRG